MSNDIYTDLDNTIVELEYAMKVQAYLEELEKSNVSLSDHISNLSRNKIALEATIDAVEVQKKIEREHNRLDRRIGRAISNMPKFKIVRSDSESESSDTKSDS